MQSVTPQLNWFEFEVVKLEGFTDGILGFGKKPITRSTKGRARSYIEDLGKRVGLEMVAIPGGTFEMGSMQYEDEHPIHRVTISPFFMGKYPVTQAQWREVAKCAKVQIDLNPEPSHFKGEYLPVESVAWFECVEFCERLSRRTEKIYRLPTEAEWEYACRAGTTEDYAGYLDAMAWYDKNSEGKTHPVGQKAPNEWGLYDMHGNVWEWCQDWHQGSYDRAPTMMRGGSWDNGAG
ncbi:MAG TPA: formylglycine-generating enzyme family protein, partial [Acidobacteriota bacterium]|nr:formylglycine-generating enzyme family protein [Acidobacteriota bacterium]